MSASKQTLEYRVRNYKMLYQFDVVLAVVAVIRGAQTTPDAMFPHCMLCSSAGEVCLGQMRRQTRR